MVQILANGIQIEADAAGDPSAVAILLIRGLGTQMIQWPPSLLRELVAAGHRVVRFDNRDVGLSQKFDSHPTTDLATVMQTVRAGGAPEVAYRLDDMAEDAIGVLDAFGIERAHVLGISMGGMIAQLVAAKHPDRTRSLISVMSSSGDPSLPAAKPEAMQVLMSRPENPLDRECVIEHGLAGRRVIGSPDYPDDDEQVRDELGRAFDRCYHPAGVARQMAAVIASGSRVPLLARIAAPTLVIHGAADPLVDIEAGRDTARRIPGARFEVIAGMGHDLPSALVPRLVDLIVEHTRKADAGGAHAQAVAPSA